MYYDTIVNYISSKGTHSKSRQLWARPDILGHIHTNNNSEYIHTKKKIKDIDVFLLEILMIKESSNLIG